MNDVNDRISLFLNNKTYVYIRLISGKFFNGYIVSKDKRIIEFQDDMLGTLPILVKEIDVLDYSNKVKPHSEGIQ